MRWLHYTKTAIIREINPLNMEQSPDQRRANPQHDFAAGNQLADIYGQLADLKRSGAASINTKSNGEVPLKVMAQAIEKSIGQMMEASKTQKLDSAAIDGILASNGVTREGNLRQSVTATVENIIRQGGQRATWQDAKSTELVDYLSDTGAHHPVNQLPETEFRKQHPGRAQVDFRNFRPGNEADELARAVNMRWGQMETNERAKVAGQQEREQKMVADWKRERQSDVFEAEDISTSTIDNQSRQQELLSQNRSARMERNQKHGAIMEVVERYSVPRQIADIIKSHGTSASPYSFEGSSKIRTADGKTREVLAQTFDLPTAESRIVISVLSGNERSGVGSGQFAEILEGAAVQSIDNYSFSELMKLAKAYKGATGKPDVSAAFTPDQINKILGAWESINQAEKDVLEKTGVNLGLSVKFHEVFGELHLPKKPSPDLPPLGNRSAGAQRRMR